MPIEEKTEAQLSSAVARATALSHGTPVAPGYEMVRPLGTGTFGEVWLARESKTGIPTAIKFFAHGTGQQWQLLQAEVKQLAQLHGDPGIVHLLDVEPDAVPPYYVMNYAEGGSLAQRLERGQLPVVEALKIFREVAEALAYVHAKGILHCDLKPGNVLLDVRGRALIADFGQAHLTSDASPALGTFFYMAPEQADTGKSMPDTGWDVYALGALLYAMLTGTPPRHDPMIRDQLAGTAQLPHRLARYREWVQQAPKPVAHRAVRGVDRQLAEIVDRSLEIDPGKRLPDAQAVLAALGRRERWRRQRPLVAFGFATPVLLLLAMGGLAFWAGQGALSRSQRTLTAQLLESDLVAARLVANAVEQQLVEKMNSVVSEAARPELGAAVQAQDQPKLLDLLENLYAQHEQAKFARWSVADSQGRILANYPKEDSVYGKNFSWRDWFSGGGDQLDSKQAVYAPIRAPHISQPFVGKSRTGGEFIGVSAPVYDSLDERKIVGVLLATVRLDELHAWLRDVYISGGFPVLLNDHLHCVQHPNPADPSSMMTPEPDINPPRWESPLFQTAISGPAGTATYTDPVDHRKYLAGYAPMKRIGWGAIVQHEHEAAMQPLAQLRIHTWRHEWVALLVGGVLVSSMWGLLLWAMRREERATDG